MARLLHPGYFALVMATGVVSTSAQRLGIAWLARPLAISMPPPPRQRRCSVLVCADLQFPHGDPVRDDKPDLAHGINGTWLIAVVGTQSVSTLGTLTARILAPWDEVALLLATVMYLFGCVLYILTITLICYQMTFLHLDPEVLSPTYWINMGAVATTTLAGAMLLRHGPQAGVLSQLAPFNTGLTTLFWVTATWWVPFLLLLGAWRHVYRSVPFQYVPEYWGMVFAFGVYALCTFDLADVMQSPLLLPIARTSATSLSSVG